MCWNLQTSPYEIYLFFSYGVDDFVDIWNNSQMIVNVTDDSQKWKHCHGKEIRLKYALFFHSAWFPKMECLKIKHHVKVRPNIYFILFYFCESVLTNLSKGTKEVGTGDKTRRHYFLFPILFSIIRLYFKNMLLLQY